MRDIVDVVLGTARPAPRIRGIVAAGVAAGVFSLVGLSLPHAQPPNAPRRAPPPAIKVSFEVSLEPPVAPRLPPSPEAPAAKASARAASRAAHSVRPVAPAAAQPQADPAAPLLTAEPAPLDLTSDTFVVGTGRRSFSGVAAPNGTASGTHVLQTASAGRDATGAAGIGLADQTWSCPWPAEADALAINDQTVIIRVVVLPDGHAESVTTVSDPGHGFGAAARTCALAARFTPARVAETATRAVSPPIKVRFTR